MAASLRKKAHESEAAAALIRIDGKRGGNATCVAASSLLSVYICSKCHRMAAAVWHMQSATEIIDIVQADFLKGHCECNSVAVVRADFGWLTLVGVAIALGKISFAPSLPCPCGRATTTLPLLLPLRLEPIAPATSIWPSSNPPTATILLHAPCMEGRAPAIPTTLHHPASPPIQ